MAFDTRKRGVVASACAVVMLWVSLAHAQDEADRVTFDVSEACSSGESVETLREAIAVRLGGEMQLVQTPQSYSVSWTSDGAGCRLLVETPSTTTPVSLAESADPDAIRNAASRAVWLLANAEPEPEPEPKPKPDPQPEEPGSEPPKKVGDDPAIDDEDQPDRDPEAIPEPPSTPEADPTAQSPVPNPGERSEPTTVDVRLGILPGFGTPFTPGPHVSRIAFNIIGWQAGVRELEIGLLANVDTDFVEGAQFAGITNVSLGRTDGFAAAGVTNISTGVHNGQQIAGLFNYAHELDGLQLSPVNLAGAWMSGAQLGGVNVAGPVSGLQFGVVNIGRRVEGLQLGLVNIAADSDYSLGLLNVNYERPMHIDLWATELGANFVGLRHGSRHIQWILATGWRPSSSNSRSMWSTGIGLGVHMPIDEQERFFLESELIDYLVFAPDPNSSDVAVGNHLQFRLDVGWRLASRFALFGGASLNLLFSDNAQAGAVTLNGPLVFESGVESRLTALWPGFQAGMRF